MSNETVTLTAEQLAAIVETAAKVAVESYRASRPGRKPKASEGTPASEAEDVSEVSEAQARREAYLQAKKDTAIELMRKKGVHYNVCKKGRKLYIWSDLTMDKARRSGATTLANLGERIWSTVEGHSLKEAAVA